MDKNISDKDNDVYLYDRKRAELSGIVEVIEFSENAVVLSCKTGEMSLEGSLLKIGSFDSETGKLTVSGRIDSVIYFEDPSEGTKSKRRKLF